MSVFFLSFIRCIHLHNTAIGAFGCQLLGRFDAEAVGRIHCLPVNLDMNIVNGVVVVPVAFGAVEHKMQLQVALLAVVNQATFVVPVGVGKGVDVGVVVYYALQDNLAREGVAAVDVNGTDKGFEGVALERAVFRDANGGAVVRNNVEKPHLVGNLVKASATYYL